MGPLSCMQSIVDQNVVMWCIPVLYSIRRMKSNLREPTNFNILYTWGHSLHCWGLQGLIYITAHISLCSLNFSDDTEYSTTIQNYQRDALNIIYSSDIITLLYMFRVSNTHLQEDIVVHKQHMVPSLCKR